jgi:serine/threonine protein kinase/formylglycine-generating enzyme required for sulfatase activity
MAPSKPPGHPEDDAEALYAELRERMRRGEEVDLDALCRERPRLAHALRALHSLDSARDGADGGGAGGDPAAEPPLTTGFADAVAGLRAPEGGAAGRPALLVGQAVGPYRIAGVLGEGGFAVVYKAEQTAPVRRFVALKAIKAGLDTRQVLARFEAERQALALMSHTSIAKVLDAGTTAEARPYFVMELVDGRPLTAFCDELRLGTTARLSLFLDVCDAIQHAHQKGIIHRDLKPANILVASEGERHVPKVIDFGIAKALAGDLTELTLQTEVGQVIGTPAYMSPEQAAGFAAEIDTRTDIYALGVILYELLTGQRPFEFSSLHGAALAEVQRAIREDDPPRPSTRVRARAGGDEALARRRDTTSAALARELRGDLDWITMKALAKRPSSRYASASELAEDVRRHLRHEPVLAGPPTWSYRLRKVVRRHRRALVSAAILIVSVSLAALAAVILSERWRFLELEEESRGLLASAEATVAAAKRIGERADELFRSELAAREELEEWQPIWERRDELDARRERSALEPLLEEEYARAFRALTRALDTAPPESEPSRKASLTLHELKEELDASWSRVSLGSVLFRDLVGMDRDPALVTGTLSISSSPPGAEVFGFRYVEEDARLVPVPLLPEAAGGARGLALCAPAREPFPGFLRVDRVWNPGRAAAASRSAEGIVFRAGDEWLSVAGRPTRTCGDLAQAVQGVALGASVPIAVRRGEERLLLDWVPFAEPTAAGPEPCEWAAYDPGRLVDIRRQLGLTFEAYPLVLSSDRRLGTTPAGAPLRLELSTGSYLFVLRKAGHIDVRVPVVGPQDLTLDVALPRAEDAPEGFVWIANGPFRHGGSDPDVFQNLPAGESDLDGFWIGRLEVSLSDYLLFVRERADDKGYCVPESPSARETFGGDRPIEVIPALGSAPRRTELIIRSEREAGWRLLSSALADSPLQGVSHLAALEYAHWLSERTPGWRFRLPSDLEWEKAARGADGRRFVWGDYFAWSFAASKLGPHPSHRRFPRERGAHPFDESVFGVRDLAGSVVELTTGRTPASPHFRSCRGSGWDGFDEYRFRTDTRFGVPADSTQTSCGIRLVAEPDRDGEQ